MPTFQELLEALPVIDEKQSGRPIRFFVGLLIALALFVALTITGWYLKRITLIYAGFVVLGVVVVAVVLDTIRDVRELRPMLTNSPEWLGTRLDRKFDSEKRIAATLRDEELSELKRMAAWIDAEVTKQEKWLDVIKPFSLLVPAAVVIVTSRFLHLPAGVQDGLTMIGSPMIIGLAIGAVSTYMGLIKLRRLATTLAYAIDVIEDGKPARFRKVSRKRGVVNI